MDYQYNNNFQEYNMMQKPPKKSIALALTGFIISLTTMLMCCCTLFPAVSVFLFIVSLFAMIMCIVSLCTKKGGKGFAIAGILISAMMCVVYLLSFTVFKGVNDDMVAFSRNPQKYIDDYHETGEIPEEFSEYTDPKYDAFWKASGYDGFEEFYKQFIEQYDTQGFSSYSYGNSNDDDESSESSTESTTLPDNYGEDPITI